MKFAVFFSILAFVWTSAMGDICPDLSYCPGDETCCPSVEGYGCCPLPEAECCSDFLHCCPGEYLCVVEYEICVKCPSLSDSRCNSTTKYESIKKRVVRRSNANQQCPDGGQCPSGSTCCMMADGEYGCCPFTEATCCSDKLHCCPSGSTCDVMRGECINEVHVIPWMEKKASIKSWKTVTA